MDTFKLTMQTEGNPEDGWHLDMYWSRHQKEWVEPDQYFGRRQWIKPAYMIRIVTVQGEQIVGKHGFYLKGV